MNAEEHLRAGRLEEALATLQDSVKASPADPRLRIFLFQLLSVLGAWDRALTQLQVLHEMDPASKLLAQIFQPVLNCEALRAEVFEGKRTPLLFGEPEEWMGSMIQVTQLTAGGKFRAAGELRDKAYEAAPAVDGKINGQAFEWIADSDERLGPLLEVFMEGKYFWAPFSRIRKIHLEPPTDLRDCVWSTAEFLWTNGGEMSGFISTRYPATELSSDGSLRLARRTEWQEHEGKFFTGLGQRMFCTDQGEFALLETRDIEFHTT